jgi:uncharacterized UBP type Zn finger protein
VHNRRKDDGNSPFLFAALREWRSGTAVGVGLVNLGNTCYLNATLQCLAHIPVVAQTLTRSKPKEQGKPKERHVSYTWCCYGD